MTKQKRNLILLAAAAAVLVVAIVLFAVLNTTGRGGERATLQQLYEGLYTTEGGGINTIIDAILPAMQQEYYNSITTGGTNFSQLAMWQNEAHSMVGGNVQVSVKVLQVQEDSATTLNTYSHITDEMRQKAAAKIDAGIAKAEPQPIEESRPPERSMTTFQARKRWNRTAG